MAFTFQSSLPKNISEADERDMVSGFQCDIDKIKEYLTEIANTYLLVAYRIYEISIDMSYKPYYKNIVEACQAELGFKKSTTYNMINIVKSFGKYDPVCGRITYHSLFGAEKFSYSQLCEMLSLSDKQRLQVSPDMSVKEIRELKKSFSDDKSSFDDTDVLIDLEPLEAPVLSKDNLIEDVQCTDTFQTSGKPSTYIDYTSDGNEFYAAPKVLIACNRAFSGDIDSLDYYDEYDFECSGCGLSFNVDNLFYERGQKVSSGNLRIRYCPRCGAFISKKQFG